MKYIYIASMSCALLSSALFAPDGSLCEIQKASDQVEELRLRLQVARRDAQQRNIPGHDSYEGPDPDLAEAFERAIAHLSRLCPDRLGNESDAPHGVMTAGAGSSQAAAAID